MTVESFAVEHAVLGFLLEEPLHGYALRERVAEGIGGFWRVASSQLYAVLHRLERAGRVTAARSAPAGGPERTVYTATPAGEAAFWRWCAAPVPHLRDLRVEFFAKLYFTRRLAPERLALLVDAQRTALETLRSGVEREGAVACDDSRIAAWARAYRRRQIAAAIGWIDALRSECGKA
jgi:DNA-binding PadR family transcriptional regulator